MKRFLSLILAAAAIMLASCAKEPVVQPQGEGIVTFTAQLPEVIATRAYSDGQTATKLHYYVYDEDNGSANIDALNGEADFIGLKAEVKLKLVTGKSYSIAFWADAPDNTVYTYDAGAKEITVAYDGAVAQDESRDAFYAYYNTFKVNGPMTDNVILKRPFAQINVGTDDLAEAAAAGFVPANSSMTVKGVYKRINLSNGAVGEDCEAVFTSAAIPAGETFPVDTYEYLGMNYVLVGAEKTTVDVVFDCGAPAGEMTFSQVPVQRNYRTNIYGSLFTDPVDFNVEISKDYDGMHNAIIVNTPSEFVSVIAAGKNVVIPENAKIDLKEEGEIELVDGQVITVKGEMNTSRAQIGISGEGNVAYVEGPGKITSMGIAGGMGNRPLNAYNGAKLVVKNVEIETEQNNGGSSIYSETGAILDLENVKVTCHHFSVGSNGASLIAKNCEFNSDSNNREGAFSYTLIVSAGCQAVLEDCTLNGVQGGIAVQDEGSVVTIKSGTYRTYDLPQYTNQTGFYAVYASGKGRAIIEGGNFIVAGKCQYSVYNGNNDIPDNDFGYIQIYGGKFNKGTLMQNQTNGITIPIPEGYEWREIENHGTEVEDLKYEVVKTM